MANLSLGSEAVVFPSSAGSGSARQLPVTDFVAVLIALLLALVTGVALAQSDGDLLAHINLGRAILAAGSIPKESAGGFATTGPTVVFPAWGSAVIFAKAHALGGLAFIVALTAVIAGFTHGIITRVLRRHGVAPMPAVFFAMIAFALASAHWLARPHLFSMLFSVCLIVLLESERRWSIPVIALLFAIWANLHGAWAYGLIVIAAWAGGDLLEWKVGDRGARWRARTGRHVLALCVAAAATLVNPWGVQLHQTVMATLRDAGVPRVIDEYRPPGFTSIPDLAFWCIAIVSAAALLRTRRRMPYPALLVVIVTTLFAVLAGRNIAFFGLVAWPLIASHLSAHTTVAQHDGARPWRLAAPAFALLLALGLAGGRIGSVQLIPARVDSARFPVTAVERMRAAGMSEPLLTTWTWSGYVPYAWPGERTWFDPLVFTPEALGTFGRMLLARPGWRMALDTQQIGAALVPPRLPLADSLGRDAAWTRWYADSVAVVFVRAK